jgi:hypothetical protein
MDVTKGAQEHANARVRKAEGRAFSVEVNSKQAVRAKRQVASTHLAAEHTADIKRKAVGV